MTKNDKTTNSRETSIKFWIQLSWILALAGVLIVGCIFLYISNSLLPDTQELENPNYEIASTIYANDNSELGKVFTTNRVWLEFKDINPHLVNALISTEDERFYDHNGIDSKGILRAVFFLGSKGGGSTITQQLAKQFFTDYAQSKITRIWQKLKEWVIAVEFEKMYTKEEIIAMYLNKFDFYYNAIGVGTASKIYFGKDQKDLEPDEAAILIGMLQNPHLYNPRANSENAFEQKNLVLRQMYKKSKLSEKDFKVSLENPINMEKFKSEDHYTGAATYFRVELTKWVKSLLKEDQYRAPDGTVYDVNTRGLKIYTTIDPIMQEYAEEAMKSHMTILQTKYLNVWKNIDPWTYRADDAQKQARTNSLLNTMRASDRFLRLRSKYLTEVTKKAMKDIPEARFYDGDIFRLYSGEKDKKYFNKLIKTNMISGSQAETYQEILQSKHWPALKKAWEALKVAGDNEFKKPVKMMVFDYQTGGEKEMTMSPLDSIKFYIKHLQLGSLAVDPKTGEVKSWVGGINHKYFQFDHVTSNRQVGSTFKPFIYGTAIIDQAMSPCFRVSDVQYCIPAGEQNFKLEKSWCPSNSDGKFTGASVTLFEGLKKSMNSVSVFLMKEIGNVERVRSFVADLGIDKKKIPEGPSICLGTAELSVMDMAGAYTTFANNGLYSKPFFVSRIEDKNGKIIYAAVPEQKKAINPSFNYVIVNLLSNVSRDRQVNFKSRIAGKTGTTNDYKDGWFVGFTPSVVIATWVGGDAQWIRFNNIADGQGSVMARPFFESYLKKIEADGRYKAMVSDTFIKPGGDLVELDCSKYVNIRPGNVTDEVRIQKIDESEEEF